VLSEPANDSGRSARALSGHSVPARSGDNALPASPLRPPVPPQTARQQSGFDLSPLFKFTPAHRWRRYRLGALDFHIRCPAISAQARLHDALGHLEVGLPAKAEGQGSPDQPLKIDIRQDAGRYDICCGNSVYAGGCTEQEIVPRLHGLLLLKAYEASGCLAAFHAAVVGNGTRCLLLPGASGSGKSTLVTAMVSMGHDYLTDELALLSRDGAITPLPVSLGLKPASWALLEPLLPDLIRLPAHLQEKGSEVRYLRPARLDARAHWADIAAVVFPRFAAGAKTQLTPLSAAESLRRLADSGYAVPGGLDADVVTALLDWISRQRCFDLQVGNLYRAAEIAGELL
jgi:hypothetical protein